MLSVDSMDRANKGWKKHSQKEAKRPFKNYLSKRKKLCCGCCTGADFDKFIRLCIFITDLFDGLFGIIYLMVTSVYIFLFSKLTGKSEDEIYGYKQIQQSRYQTEFREQQNKSGKMLKRE